MSKRPSDQIHGTMGATSEKKGRTYPPMVILDPASEAKAEPWLQLYSELARGATSSQQQAENFMELAHRTGEFDLPYPFPPPPEVYAAQAIAAVSRLIESKRPAVSAMSPPATDGWFCNLTDGSCTSSSSSSGATSTRFPTSETCQSSCRYNALVDAYNGCRMSSFSDQLTALMSSADTSSMATADRDRRIRSDLLPNMFRQPRNAGVCVSQAAAIDSILNRLYPTDVNIVDLTSLLNTFLLDLSEGNIPVTISRRQITSIFRQIVQRFYNIKGTVDFAQVLRSLPMGTAGFKKLLPLLIDTGSTVGMFDAVNLLHLLRYWPVPFRFMLDAIIASSSDDDRVGLKLFLRDLARRIKSDPAEVIVGPLATRMKENLAANLQWLNRTISKL